MIENEKKNGSLTSEINARMPTYIFSLSSGEENGNRKQVGN